MSIILAIDVMGGDFAPNAAIEGIKLFLAQYDNVHFRLYGDQTAIKANIKGIDPGKLTIIHCEHAIADDDKPTNALKQKGLESSMAQAITAIVNKQAHGVISSGNTGAYMVLARKIMGVKTGIDRPAIAKIMPHAHKDAVLMLDLGANIDPKPEYFLQMAQLGTQYAQTAMNIDNPKVSLLNIGKESIKGNALIKQAAQILTRDCTNFAGFDEGSDIFFTENDVIVCDGFSGNIAMKSMEGTAAFIQDRVKQAIKKSFLMKLCLPLIYLIFQAVKKYIDINRYNGAIFLGLKDLAVKSHGNSDGKSFFWAIYNTMKIIQQQEKKQS